MKTEIAAMQDLCHQHICKLFQVIETADRFFMILEVLLPFIMLPVKMDDIGTYIKYSNILNTFLVLFSDKMLIF